MDRSRFSAASGRSSLCGIVPGRVSVSDLERSVFADTFSATSSPHPYVLRCVPTFLGSLHMPHPRCGPICWSRATAFDSSRAAVESSSWAPRSSHPMMMSLVPESFFESFFFMSLGHAVCLVCVQRWSVHVCVWVGAALPGGLAVIVGKRVTPRF